MKTTEEILRRINMLFEVEMNTVQWNTASPTNSSDSNDDKAEDNKQTANNTTTAPISKKEVDAMSDGDAVYNVIANKDQSKFDQSAKSALVKKINDLAQKSQNGSLTDKAREDIINAIIANAKDNA